MVSFMAGLLTTRPGSHDAVALSMPGAAGALLGVART
jgi:hypothetical protein